MELQELRARRIICLACIRIIEEASDSDPRKAEALEEYKKQLAELDDLIAGKPPDIVVGLKPAVLFADPGGSNG
jgi:hypothetical protein